MRFRLVIPFVVGLGAVACQGSAIVEVRQEPKPVQAYGQLQLVARNALGEAPPGTIAELVNDSLKKRRAESIPSSGELVLPLLEAGRWIVTVHPPDKYMFREPNPGTKTVEVKADQLNRVEFLMMFRDIK
jgi:hypothetical protein